LTFSIAYFFVRDTTPFGSWLCFHHEVKYKNDVELEVELSSKIVRAFNKNEKKKNIKHMNLFKHTASISNF
jgi:hypothetical protein